MDSKFFIRQMEHSAEAIKALVVGLDDKQSRWRPDPDSWSVLEVVNHLLDEEREDFRVRLDILLHRPEDPWPPIDPQGWVTARKYNERFLEPSLDGFLVERKRSIEWLNGLVNPDFSSFVESKFGVMSAGDMFAAWVAHDMLHLRQLVELRYAYLQAELAPYNPGYAGDF